MTNGAWPFPSSTKPMKKEPVGINFYLLKVAYNIFKDIPAKQVALNSIVKEFRPANNHCGTIACGMGWLGLKPEFTALGLTTNADHHLDYRSRKTGVHHRFYVPVAQDLFNCDEETAKYIFGQMPGYAKTVQYKGWKRRALKGDKAELLRRIEVVFLAHDKAL